MLSRAKCETSGLNQVWNFGVQMGYNLLYGLWKYSWDADCDLFLKILKGEVKEDVYLEQVQLQVMSTSALTCAPCVLAA